MVTTDLATYRDSIKRLVEKSVFMPTKLREKIFKKLADPTISREKLDRIKNLLEKSSEIEKVAVKQILQKDSLFFVKLKRQRSHEKFDQIRNQEKFSRDKELWELEKEMDGLLTNLK
jgi:hypothetical protein